MSNSPILTLKNITLGLGDQVLFDDISLTINEGDRLCLVGRNGAGKSTFMKVMAGLIEPDDGEIVPRIGLEVSMLDQNPYFEGYEFLIDYAKEGLAEHETYLVEGAFEGLGLPLDLRTENASGGEKRKAGLARLISKEADLWLLDEPTNHLDIQAIEWLESTLNARRTGAYILISHDRQFLKRLSRGTLWLDRTKMRRKNEGYAAFEDWRDQTYAEEKAKWQREDKFIEEEQHWAVEGISARRKRNQGRLRRLEGMKEEAGSRIKQERRAELILADSDPSGKLIAEIKNGNKSYGKPIFKDFNIKITRGQRLAVVGPNGAGKSTLIRVLLGLEALDSGRYRQGLNQQVAYFDQAREKFKPDATLATALTDNEKLSVKGREDQVMVRGQPRHVYAYLKAFLFKPSQVKSPVSTLSGGERARLILAKIMAEESNVLVLDEPTNDLDVETLDMLQEVIDDYSGTVILVSHDRDFVDRIAERTIFMDGQGNAQVYAGGWSDLVDQGGGFESLKGTVKAKKKKTTAQEAYKSELGKLTFIDQHRLEELPHVIERIEKEIAKLEELLSDANLFTENPVKFQKASALLEERQTQLLEAEEEWLVLEEKRAEFEPK